MRIPVRDLGLERLAVAFPGEARYALDERIEVMPLSEVNRLARRPDDDRRRR